MMNPVMQTESDVVSWIYRPRSKQDDAAQAQVHPNKCVAICEREEINNHSEERTLDSEKYTADYVWA